MSRHIPQESFDYVKGLRTENARLRAALQVLIGRADDLIAAIDGATRQFEPETAAFSDAASAAERALMTA